MYELPNELPNDLRLQNNVQNNVKTSRKYNLVPSLPPKKKTLSMLAKESSKIEVELFP